MVFPAACATCGETRKFIEFKAEPCTPGSEAERRYGFRCMGCKTILEEITDQAGARHSWVGGKHVAA